MSQANAKDIRLFALRNDTLRKAFAEYPQRFPRTGPKEWKSKRIVYLNPSLKTRRLIHQESCLIWVNSLLTNGACKAKLCKVFCLYALRQAFLSVGDVFWLERLSLDGQ